MGRVTQRGDTLLIQTDLVNVADGAELWGDQFNRKVSDLIAVQGDIAKEIYDNLRPASWARMKSARSLNTIPKTPKLPALSAGPFLLEQVDGRRVQESHRLFQSGSRKSPHYAQAYAGLADTYTFWASPDTRRRSRSGKRQSAAMQAVKLDDSLPEAHISLGLRGKVMTGIGQEPSPSSSGRSS